ncbi:hypothetical protein FJZ48_04200, partial [Candidatus Uhrbacteria bacterium]|nr:hypothetical protein [Candidatus Uhrbacteria bacterium]
MVTTTITVNERQCQKIGEILGKLKFRHSFFERPYITFSAEPEMKVRCYLLSLAICHQTHTLISRTKNLKGWEVLEDVFMRLTQENSDMINMQALAAMSVTELTERLRPLFADDGDLKHCTLDRLEERSRFLIDIAEQLVKSYDGSLMKLVEQSDGFVTRLYALLDRFEAYKDPMRKKATCFIKFSVEAKLFTVKDPENILPIMDYHMQRVLLRTGCVEINDQDLKQKLQGRETLTSDEEIRQACVDATRLLAIYSGYPIANMNDFLWPL